jgi:hypothetical protein
MEKQVDAAVVLKSLEKDAAPLIRALQKIAIKDLDSYNLASSKVSALKQLAKIADAREKSLTDPLKKVLADIKDLFSPFKKMIAKLEDDVKTEMLEYHMKVEKQKAKVEENLANGKIVNLSTAVRKMAELEVIPTSSQTRQIWVLEEIDTSVTPIEYMVPDRAKITEAFKRGEKVLGWKWVQKKTIAI